MSRYTKTMFASHRVANGLEFFAMKFNQPIALFAVQMIVLGVAVIVLVNPASAKVHRPQQTGIHQFLERAVDGRPADAFALDLGTAENQFVGIEMIVPLENMIDQLQPLLRDSLAPALQVLDKPLPRRRRDFHRFKGKFASHDSNAKRKTKGRREIQNNSDRGANTPEPHYSRGEGNQQLREKSQKDVIMGATPEYTAGLSSATDYILTKGTERSSNAAEASSGIRDQGNRSPLPDGIEHTIDGAFKLIGRFVSAAGDFGAEAGDQIAADAIDLRGFGSGLGGGRNINLIGRLRGLSPVGTCRGTSRVRTLEGVSAVNLMGALDLHDEFSRGLVASVRGQK